MPQGGGGRGTQQSSVWGGSAWKVKPLPFNPCFYTFGKNYILSRENFGANLWLSFANRQNLNARQLSITLNSSMSSFSAADNTLNIFPI